MRSRPQEGIHSTCLSIASSAFFLKSPASIEANHCSVARNMIGDLHLQQCGYECLMSSFRRSAPFSFKIVMIFSLALNTNWPSNSGTSFVNFPWLSTGL